MCLKKQLLTSSPRLWSEDNDDDPLAGMINLFDLWIVVVVGLMIALVGKWKQGRELGSESLAEKPSETLVADQKELVKLPKFRKTKSEMSGQGEVLGTAYRFSSGEVVYVPQATP